MSGSQLIKKIILAFQDYVSDLLHTYLKIYNTFIIKTINMHNNTNKFTRWLSGFYITFLL